MGIRESGAEHRYRPTENLRAKSSNNSQLRIRDISANGISFSSRANSSIDISGIQDCCIELINIACPSTAFSFPFCLKFNDLQKRSEGDNTVYYSMLVGISVAQMTSLMHHLRKNGCIKDNPSKHSTYANAIYELIDKLPLSKLPLTRDMVFQWLEANAIDHATDAPNILECMSVAFSKAYYLSSDQLEDCLVDTIAKVNELAPKPGGWECMHIFPMHMPRTMEQAVLQNWNKVLNNAANSLKTHEKIHLTSLYEFLTESKCRHCQQNMSIVAIDCFVNTGAARDRLLNLIARKAPRQLKKHVHIFRVALIGHAPKPIAREIEIDIAANGHKMETVKLAVTDLIIRPVEKRPFDNDPASCSFTPAQKDFIDEFHKKRLGLLYAHYNKSTSSLVSFNFGCPMYNLPIFWANDINWRALIPRIEYYDPSLRPLPRAPLFIAHKGTLNALLEKIKKNGCFILAGARGAGKTYSASQAVEIVRRGRYIFWHSFFDFDTIEGFLEHVDAFLGQMGVVDLGSNAASTNETRLHWLERHSISEIVERIISDIEYSDRDLLMVFDEVENVAPSLNKMRSHAIVPSVKARTDEKLLWNFICAFSKAIAQRDPNREPHITLFFICRTYAVGFTRFLSECASELGVVPENRIICPSEKDWEDYPGESIYLAEKVLKMPLTPKLREIIIRLGHYNHYNAWLICFVANRLFREKALGQRFDEILRISTPSAYLNINSFHRILDVQLFNPAQRLLLRIASAFSAPWSKDILDKVCSVLSANYTEAFAINHELDNFIEDCAPFLISLNLLPQQYEMPSIARDHFRKFLEEENEKACAVYSAIGQIFMKEAHEGGKTAQYHSLSSLRFQSAFYLCKGLALDNAIEMYKTFFDPLHSRISWERVLFIGDLLFELIRAEKCSAHANQVMSAARIYLEALLKLGYYKQMLDIFQYLTSSQFWNDNGSSENIEIELLHARALRCLGYYAAAQKSIKIYRDHDFTGMLKTGVNFNFDMVSLSLARGNIPDAIFFNSSARRLMQQIKSIDAKMFFSLRLRFLFVNDLTIKMLHGNMPKLQRKLSSYNPLDFIELQNKFDREDIFSSVEGLIPGLKSLSFRLEIIRELESLSAIAPLSGTLDRSKIKKQLDITIRAAFGEAETAYNMVTKKRGYDFWWRTITELLYAELYLLIARHLDWLSADIVKQNHIDPVREAQSLLSSCTQAMKETIGEIPRSRMLEVRLIGLMLEMEELLRTKNDNEKIDFSHAADKFEKLILEQNALEKSSGFAPEDDACKDEARSAPDYAGKGFHAFHKQRLYYEYMLFLHRIHEHNVIACDKSGQLKTFLSDPSHNNNILSCCNAYLGGTRIAYAMNAAQSSRKLQFLALRAFQNESLALRERLEATCILFSEDIVAFTQSEVLKSDSVIIPCINELLDKLFQCGVKLLRRPSEDMRPLEDQNRFLLFTNIKDLYENKLSSIQTSSKSYAKVRKWALELIKWITPLLNEEALKAKFQIAWDDKSFAPEKEGLSYQQAFQAAKKGMTDTNEYIVLINSRS